MHHTCKSSYTLYKALRDIDGVEFEMAKTPYFQYLRNYVLSVPAVFHKGELMLLDPIEPEDVINLKEGREPGELTVEEAVDNFIRGVMASQAILSTVMLYKSLKPTLDPHLVAILSRAKYHRDEKTPQIMKAIEKNEREILTQHWQHLIKLLTYGIVRELFWLGIDIEEVEKTHIKMWILAKATVGRLGLPHPKPTVPQDVVEAVYNTLRESGQRYLDKIREEQMMLNDSEFLSLLQE